MKALLNTIISGGQTGVDRAALDVALKLKITCGGWCPKGRLAEDGIIAPRYPLKESFSIKAEIRTELNVLDATGTLILIKDDEMDKGTRFTIEMCKMYNKPYLRLNLNDQKKDLLSIFNTWKTKYKIGVLNVAGPRESSSPGLYTSSYTILKFLFTR